MIFPRLRSIIAGASAWASRNGARRLTARVRSQSSARVSMRDCGWENAALLTRMSIAPKWSRARRAAKGFEVMRALRTGQAAMVSIQGGIVGEARIVERAFGV